MIDRYTPSDKKIKGSDLNSLIDAYNARSDAPSFENGMSSNDNFVTWNDPNIVIDPAQLIRSDSTSVIIKKFSWIRNGFICEPLTGSAWDVGFAANQLDEYYTLINLSSTDWSTSTSNTGKNGMVYISACLSANANATSNTCVMDIDEWRAGNVDTNPALAPTEVIYIKTKQSDYESNKLFSHAQSQTDSCIKLIGAVSVNATGDLLNIYQYRTGHIIDEWDSKPWDIFDITTSTNANSNIVYMVPGCMSYHGSTDGAGNYLTSTPTTYRGLSLTSFEIPSNCASYAYASCALCDATSGVITSTVTMQDSTSLSDAQSNSTNINELIYKFTYNSNDVLTDFIRYRDESVDVWHLISDVKWDRTGNAKLQYRRPYCDYWTDILEAAACSTT